MKQVAAIRSLRSVAAPRRAGTLGRADFRMSGACGCEGLIARVAAAHEESDLVSAEAGPAGQELRRCWADACLCSWSRYRTGAWSPLGSALPAQVMAAACPGGSWSGMGRAAAPAGLIGG